MTMPDISKATDPDLRALLSTIQRAAALARKTAIQTETDIVIVENGELVHISANQLRQIDSLSNQKKNLRGALKDYANPSLIASESTAWQNTANDS